jgi:predicted Ser/Thr protein kinase
VAVDDAFDELVATTMANAQLLSNVIRQRCLTPAPGCEVGGASPRCNVSSRATATRATAAKEATAETEVALEITVELDAATGIAILTDNAPACPANDLQTNTSEPETEGSQTVFVGQGQRGCVTRCGIVATKRRHGHAPESTMLHEAFFLQFANLYGIGPRLLSAEADSVSYEYVDGTPILEHLQAPSVGRSEICAIFQQIFVQLHKLDKLGVSKHEMCWPAEHILIVYGHTHDGSQSSRRPQPVLLDFERCTYRPWPSKAQNVSQFVQFLTSRTVRHIMTKKDIGIEPGTAYAFARHYKLHVLRPPPPLPNFGPSGLLSCRVEAEHRVPVWDPSMLHYYKVMSGGGEPCLCSYYGGTVIDFVSKLFSHLNPGERESAVRVTGAENEVQFLFEDTSMVLSQSDVANEAVGGRRTARRLRMAANRQRVESSTRRVTSDHDNTDLECTT